MFVISRLCIASSAFLAVLAQTTAPDSTCTSVSNPPSEGLGTMAMLQKEARMEPTLSASLLSLSAGADAATSESNDAAAAASLLSLSAGRDVAQSADAVTIDNGTELTAKASKSGETARKSNWHKHKNKHSKEIWMILVLLIASFLFCVLVLTMLGAIGGPEEKHERSHQSPRQHRKEAPVEEADPFRTTRPHHAVPMQYHRDPFLHHNRPLSQQILSSSPIRSFAPGQSSPLVSAYQHRLGQRPTVRATSADAHLMMTMARTLPSLELLPPPSLPRPVSIAPTLPPLPPIGMQQVTNRGVLPPGTALQPGVGPVKSFSYGQPVHLSSSGLLMAPSIHHSAVI